MEIHQLQYVVAVAKHKHFTRAADEINVGQSALSQQIAKLESELGVKLFDRTSRTVFPTPAGIEFIEYARGILNQIARARQCMDAHAGLLKGTLSIGTITSLTNIDFGQMIASFHDAYPGISLNIIQDGSIKLTELLRACEIDIAIVTLPPMEFKDLEFFPLTKDEYVLVTSDKHPLALKKVIDLAEAHDEDFIFHNKAQSMYAICMQACIKAGFEPRIFCYSSGASISFDMIRAGLGIGFFPTEQVKAYRFSGLASIRLRETLTKHVMLATPKKTKSPAVTALYQHVIDWVSGMRSFAPLPSEG
jgi:LysR family transcriptional activator of glutamate synthase operon